MDTSHGDGGELKYATLLSAGLDLPYSGVHYIDGVPWEDDLPIGVGERALLGTGLMCKGIIPADAVGLVCPKSGLAVKKGITVLNGPGIIDSDYEGELMVPIINLGQEPVSMVVGKSIAQLVIVPCIRGMWTIADKVRGKGGFDSTRS